MSEKTKKGLRRGRDLPMKNSSRTDVFSDVRRRSDRLFGVRVLPVGRVGEEVLEGGQGEGSTHLRHVL